MPSRDLAGAAEAAPGTDASIVLNVPFVGRESLARMRYAVAAHGPALGLAGERLDAMVVIVHELAANAVLHGGGRGRLRLWARGDAVYCEVSDDGPGIGMPGGGPPSGPGGRPVVSSWPVSAPPDGYERGRGIFCVQQLADSLHIRSGASGTVVTAAIGRLPN